MKAIILAAGKGERLKSLTQGIPKPMLEVKGEIILEHNLIWLRRYGIKEVFINLHHAPDKIGNYFGDGDKWKTKINYSYEKSILGTAGAVRKILKDYSGMLKDSEFLIIYGDNFYPFKYHLKKFINFHFNNKNIFTIGLYEKKEEIYKSGVVAIDKNNLMIDFMEKPRLGHRGLSNEYDNRDCSQSGLINTGVYLLNKKIIDFIPRGKSDFGKDVFPNLIKKRISMHGYIFEAPLIAIDTIELYKKVTR